MTGQVVGQVAGRERERVIPEALARLMKKANANAGGSWHHAPRSWDFKKKGQYEAALPDHADDVRQDEAGAFGTNNGMLAVFDGDGVAYVIPFKEMKRHATSPGRTLADDYHSLLTNAGFDGCGCWVPHSNDGGAWAVRQWPEAFAEQAAT